MPGKRPVGSNSGDRRDASESERPQKNLESQWLIIMGYFKPILYSP